MILKCGEIQWFISDERELYFYTNGCRKTTKQFRAWIARKERQVKSIDSPIGAVKHGTNQPSP